MCLLRFVEKHFQDKSPELQIPPLRFATVPRQAGTGGMTKVMVDRYLCFCCPIRDLRFVFS